MAILAFLVVLGVGFVLLAPLVVLLLREQKATGVVWQPHIATLVGGCLIGVVLDFGTPAGTVVWSVLLDSDLGLSSLTSRALTAATFVIAGLVVALYLQMLVQKMRRPRE